MEINTHFLPSDVVARECKNVSYSTDREKKNDFVLVKEVIHTKDGRLIPRLVMRENYKRPVYVTQEQHRNHREKKEYEKKSNCVELWTTDVAMNVALQGALGIRFPDPKKKLRQICSSPYVYWADLKVTTYIKEKYLNKWPNDITPNRLCVYDTETNEREGTKEPNVMSFVCDDEIHFYATKSYMDRIEGGEETIVKKALELLSKVPFSKNKDGDDLPEGTFEYRDLIKDYKLFTHTCATAGQCIYSMFQQIHRMLPDLVVAWNHEFDISKMLETLERENIDPCDVFCHPDVPQKYRRVWFKKDLASKRTESKTLTKSPADQWHVLYCMASFFCVDAMCLFKKIRTHEGNRPTYKLGYTLQTEIGVGKLDLPQLPYEDNLDWHVKAQNICPAEYAVYNIMDNLLIILLDKKTNDLASAISILAGVSMYDIFPSLPKRICDAFTYYLYRQGLVIGSVGREMRNEYDNEVIGTDGWIVTLPAHMNAENGLDVLKEINSFYSSFRGQAADADLTQAYPSANNMLNQSRETTCIELISIDGVSEDARRRAGVNLTAGRVNAMEIANELFKMPDIETVFNAFQERMAPA